jgi:hypothetical protein
MDDSGAPRPDPPNDTRLRPNKRIRTEALRAGWEGTWKRFVDITYLESCLNAKIVPSQYKWLSRVHLNLSLSAYFSLFSLRINPVIHIDAANSNGTIPQSIPGLKRLEFFFRDPYTSDASFLSNGVLATGSSTIGS